MEHLAAREDVEAEISVKTGELEEMLPRLVHERGIDLLMINRGAGESNEDRGLSLHAYAAIRSAPCPVLSL